MAKAVENSYKNIITSGAIGSNHCRATAAVSVALGIKPYLFLRSDLKVSNQDFYSQSCQQIVLFVYFGDIFIRLHQNTKLFT